MRKSVLITLLALITLAALGSTALTGFPRLLQYQGVITDTEGVPITNNSLSLRYLIFDVPAGGDFLWAEVTQVAVTDGKVDHLLGSVTPLPDSIFTERDSIWLEIMVDGEPLDPRILLVPSAYSMRVATIDQATGGDVFGDVWIHSDLTVGDQAGSSGRILVYDGAGPRIIAEGTEAPGQGSVIKLSKANTLSAIDLDAEDTDGIAHIWLYHDLQSTMDIAASVSDTLGSQILMYTLAGNKNIEIDAEFPGESAIGGGPGVLPEGRIGVNSDPDSGAVHAHSDNKYTGYFTNDYGGSFPVAVKAEFTGGGAADPIAVWGESWPSDGKGSGGFFKGGEHGVRAIAEGGDASHGVSAVEGFAYGNNDGDRYGVYGIAQGGNVAHGVYGFASQGNSNWSSFFAGNNWMSRLAIGTNFVAATGTYAPTPPGYSLAVNGKVLCEEVEVLMSDDWPDYVFEPDYELMSLPQIKAEIEAKGHLPGVPSAQEIAEEGVALGSMQATLMEKVEELTLHMIALGEDMQELRSENEALKSLVASLTEEGAQR